MKTFIFISILLFMCFRLFAQDTTNVDTTHAVKLDKVEMRGKWNEDKGEYAKGSIMYGEVTSVGAYSVSFKMSGGMLMDILKSDIKRIDFASGSVLEFRGTKQEQTTKSGGLSVWGIVGIVFATLLVVGGVFLLIASSVVGNIR